MKSIEVAITIYNDNFCILVHDNEQHLTAAIDAPDTNTILNLLKKKGWILTHIFNTHQHIDHTLANLELKKIFNCEIFGPLIESDQIPGIDHGLTDGELLYFGKHIVKIISTPGHTIGHICYNFLEDNLLFVGDTLFSIGCGKIHNGNYYEMFESLKKISSIAEKTLIYFGHEYTYKNALFALYYDPNNIELQQYFSKIKSLYKANLYTNPTSLSLEKKTNPFLRTGNVMLKKNLNMEKASDIEVFVELRKRKDKFKQTEKMIDDNDYTTK
ncbi:MAG: hydroxyacylglutathione hydrolase [Candidatus Liberibacter europaeus]|uniref:Hydroxyacylglutathione hydrolase n=1 Tax=Candidatus Liberibacter europaeus TaxID=744859 RepID=A0A2T4VYE7_9HYPH|nr:hydroxyacylglutathione hydrolase [Candidatus Liberibacter europaeus]PTL86802.1 MAG: hydroxyacylglutathione hydrolase [Candidatus Liberibacter europaeus]